MRQSIKGCSPTVPEEGEQSRSGDSDQQWPQAGDCQVICSDEAVQGHGTGQA